MYQSEVYKKLERERLGKINVAQLVPGPDKLTAAGTKAKDGSPLEESIFPPKTHQFRGNRGPHYASLSRMLKKLLPCG